MSCCLLYRGEVGPREIADSINSIKARKTVRFVDWVPTGCKVGINSQAPEVTKNS